LFAVDKSAGSIRWSFCPDAPASVEVAAASDDVVFAFSWSKNGADVALVAIDAANGVERWRAPVSPQQTAAGPFAGSGTIVVVGAADAAGHLIGLSAETGDEQWRVPVQRYVVPLANTESVVVINGHPSDPGPPFLQGLDRTTGEQRWQSNVVMSDPSGVSGSRVPVAASGDTVVVPTGPSTIAVDAGSGQERWHGDSVGSPFAAEETVVGRQGRDEPTTTVQGLDLATGSKRWSASGRPSYGEVWSTGDGAVFVADGQEIVGYELADGAERWRMPMPEQVPITEPMAADDDRVYVGWEVFVAAWSTDDATPRWELRPDLVEPAWITGVATNDTLALVSLSDFAPTD
jgi:outer membrane protein assembly factor BamB